MYIAKIAVCDVLNYSSIEPSVQNPKQIHQANKSHIRNEPQLKLPRTLTAGLKPFSLVIITMFCTQIIRKMQENGPTPEIANT